MCFDGRVGDRCAVPCARSSCRRCLNGDTLTRVLAFDHETTALHMLSVEHLVARAHVRRRSCGASTRFDVFLRVLGLACGMGDGLL